VRPDPGARERVIDLLQAAFVQGRLTREEFGTRVGQALESWTGAELAAVTADLPAELIGTLPRHPPARARRRMSMNTAVTGGAGVVVAANVGMIAAIVARSPIAVILVALFTVVAAGASIGAMMVAR
jgi:Domain of unknown function (DUF1707)